ncbi:MAG TPA: DUF4416 family protein, partial [Desulfobacterales bacterium]|nr:DUF4416 family protein [Desulfobacterales bacterium]
LLGAVAEHLAGTFGAIDLVSPWFPFDFTGYYEPEMGSPLFRRVLSFKSHVEPGSLADIKITTNRIEQLHARDGKRRVNLDPGILTHERFVLATCKDFSHRIYLGRGIYADLTLLYRKGRFETLPWTYPDYAHHNPTSFLQRVRKKYVFDVKTKRTRG